MPNEWHIITGALWAIFNIESCYTPGYWPLFELINSPVRSLWLALKRRQLKNYRRNLKKVKHKIIYKGRLKDSQFIMQHKAWPGQLCMHKEMLPLDSFFMFSHLKLGHLLVELEQPVSIQPLCAWSSEGAGRLWRVEPLTLLTSFKSKHQNWGTSAFSINVPTLWVTSVTASIWTHSKHISGPLQNLF